LALQDYCGQIFSTQQGVYFFDDEQVWFSDGSPQNKTPLFSAKDIDNVRVCDLEQGSDLYMAITTNPSSDIRALMNIKNGIDVSDITSLVLAPQKAKFLTIESCSKNGIGLSTFSYTSSRYSEYFLFDPATKESQKIRKLSQRPYFNESPINTAGGLAKRHDEEPILLEWNGVPFLVSPSSNIPNLAIILLMLENDK
jgi:hypothetical protein